MRDLKADLDWMMKSPSDHAKELQIAVHALKRAIEAESLARELVEALKHIERLAELARSRSRYPGAVMSYGAEIRLAVEWALDKAKEVLGDE